MEYLLRFFLRKYLIPYSRILILQSILFHYQVSNGIIVITIDSNKDPVLMRTGIGFSSRILGHTLRFDWAWGIENKQFNPGRYYISLNSSL